MSLISLKFESGTLTVKEHVRGYDIVDGKSVPATFTVETSTRDRDRILEFFCGVAVRAISKRGRR